jgi:peptidoglycan/LPS O-acetylase OafA/YrhL
LFFDVLGLAAILTAALGYPVLNLLVPDLMQHLGAAVDPIGHMSQWTARSIMIVAGTLLSPTAQAFLSLPISLFLGRISFGLYLLHLPIFFSIGIGSYLAVDRIWGHEPASVVASLVVLSASLLSALAFHHAIERPSIRFANKASALTTSSAPLPLISKSS